MERKFEVGDRVSFDWGGRKGTGKIVETETGLLDCSILVQLEGELRGEGHDGNGHSKRKYATDDYYYFKPISLTLISEESIHITREDNTVHAILKNGKNVAKRSKAVCSPDDEFDFETGAKLAMSRLFEGSKKDLLPYKVGDKVKLKDSFEGLHNLNGTMKCYEGKIVTISSIRTTTREDSNFIVRIEEDHGTWCWNDFFIEGLAKDCLPEYVEILGDTAGTRHRLNVGDACKVIDLSENGRYLVKRLSDICSRYIDPKDVKPLKAVKRPAEVGEYIMLISEMWKFNRIGDVLKVSSVPHSLVKVEERNHPRSLKKNHGGYLWNYTSRTYVVLEGYIPTEMMTPHLEDDRGEFYGTLGTPTNLKDLRGEPLFVGDVVELFTWSHKYRGDSIVVSPDGEPFIKTWPNIYDNDGNSKSWIVIKKKSYKDLEKGEVYRSVHRVDPKEK